ncbi:MAG TPA: carboxypeptidase regulatory-like domain-containing protein [Humisphaera sp.]
MAVVTGGCNREQPAPPKPEVAPGKGVVAGVVMFDGPPAAPKQVGTEKCCDAQTPIYDESLVVDAGGGMRNVVVFLENGPNVPTPASEPVVLDQVKCRYVPHVLAVRTGQTLRLKSTDPTLHNVHGQSTKNRAFNQSFTAPGESKDVTLAKPEWFEVRCDVHKWMSAWVAAFDHPFFAVTGEGGRFELKGVPAGTYTLVARHERYGEKRVQVTVPPGEAPAAVTAELRFAQ